MSGKESDRKVGKAGGRGGRKENKEIGEIEINSWLRP